MKTFGIACALLLLVTNVASADMSIEKYFQESGNAQDKAFTRLWLSGVSQGYTVANVANKQRGVPPFFCEPQKVALTPDQIEDILDRYLKTSKLPSEAPLSLALFYALSDAFPCDGR